MYSKIICNLGTRPPNMRDPYPTPVKNFKEHRFEKEQNYSPGRDDKLLNTPPRCLGPILTTMLRNSPYLSVFISRLKLLSTLYFSFAALLRHQSILHPVVVLRSAFVRSNEPHGSVWSTKCSATWVTNSSRPTASIAENHKRNARRHIHLSTC